MAAIMTHRSPSAPALLRRMEVVLNQWFHFGKAVLTTRLPGLSMVSQTRFGIFHSDQWPDDDLWLCDDLSGLSVRLDGAERCELLQENAGGALRCDLSLRSRAELSVAGSRPNDSIAELFEARIQSSDPEPWLDEWTDCAQACAGCQIGCRGKADCIRKWHEIEITIVASDLRFRVKFRPNWIDRDMTVLRLSDAGQQRVIHVDLASPFLSLRQTAENAGELFFEYP